METDGADPTQCRCSTLSDPREGAGMGSWRDMRSIFHEGRDGSMADVAYYWCIYAYLVTSAIAPALLITELHPCRKSAVVSAIVAPKIHAFYREL